MNKTLYEFHELLNGVLEAGMIAETINLGELNYKLWFNPETYELEYKDYPDQIVKIMCNGHKDFSLSIPENEEVLLFRILP